MANESVQCGVCGGSGVANPPAPGVTRGGTIRCATCYSVIEIDGRKSRIQVSGSDAKEFASVANNGEVLCQSEGYKRRLDADNTVARLLLSIDPIYIKVNPDPEARVLGGVPEDGD